jgi:MATE family multidrug resistance protein
VNKDILKLAIPNILSNLSVPLLGIVDTALVGHLSEAYYLGAVAIGGAIFNFIYWGFGFLRMGTTGLTAQALGRKNQTEISEIFYRALIVALGGAVLLIALQYLILNLALIFIHASGEVEFYASSYFFIRIYAAPATLSLYVILGWLLGMQDAKTPLLLTVSGNILNIIFSYIFIYLMDMSSDGVALGTVFAQYFTLIFAVFLLYKKFTVHFVKIPFSHLITLDKFTSFFKLNGDIFLRTMSLVFVFSFFTAKSAEFGDLVLAANTILIQLWMVFSYGIDGFAFAAESLVGKSFGAKDFSTLKKLVETVFLYGGGLGLVFSIVYFVFDDLILSIFTNNNAIISTVMVYWVWTIVAPFINSFCYIWDGIYLGATVSKPLRNSMLFSTFIVFLPAFYLGREFYGNHGIWAAMLFFMAARGISLTLLANKNLFRSR